MVDSNNVLITDIAMGETAPDQKSIEDLAVLFENGKYTLYNYSDPTNIKAIHSWTDAGPYKNVDWPELNDRDSLEVDDRGNYNYRRYTETGDVRLIISNSNLYAYIPVGIPYSQNIRGKLGSKLKKMDSDTCKAYSYSRCSQLYYGQIWKMPLDSANGKWKQLYDDISMQKVFILDGKVFMVKLSTKELLVYDLENEKLLLNTKIYIQKLSMETNPE